MGSEARFLFLGERLGDAGFGAVVVGADVFPEVAVDAADPLQFPRGMGEFLDQETLVCVRGPVGLVEAVEQRVEFCGVFVREQVRVGGAGGLFVCGHKLFPAFTISTGRRSTPKFDSVNC